MRTVTPYSRYGSLGTALTYLGEPREGIEASNKSLRLDPQNPAAFFRYVEIAFGYLVLRDYEESCEGTDVLSENNADGISGKV
jgi:hypothetical protein